MSLEILTVTVETRYFIAIRISSTEFFCNEEMQKDFNVSHSGKIFQTLLY